TTNGRVLPESTYYRLRKQAAIREAVAEHLARQLPDECHQTISEHLLERRDVRDVLNVFRAAIRKNNRICMLRLAERSFCDFKPQDVDAALTAAQETYGRQSLLDVLVNQEWSMATILEQIGNYIDNGASPADVLTAIIDDAGYRNWSLDTAGGQMAPEYSALDRLIAFARHYDGSMESFIELVAPRFVDDGFHPIDHLDHKLTPDQLAHIEQMSVTEPAPKAGGLTGTKKRIKRQSVW
ncbi:hypothetical protein CR162_06720, partial [Pseudoroseomonas rhizosphaerae]